MIGWEARSHPLQLGLSPEAMASWGWRIPFLIAGPLGLIGLSGVALLFFAGFCVLVGALILRTRLVPRLIGLLMVLAGACYAVNTLALVLSPALSERLLPAILLPPFVGELSLALWLLVKGVRPRAQAHRPRPVTSQAT